MQHPEKPAEVAARDVITHLQQSVHALMDADRVLPEEGLSLLATLDRALAGPSGASATSARSGIAAYSDWVQALIDAEVLDAAEGRPWIAAAAALGAGLPKAEGTDPELPIWRGDTPPE
jgi:hypothetical protein